MIYPNWTTKFNVKAATICRVDTDSILKNSDLPRKVVWLNQCHGTEICNLDKYEKSENFLETYQLYKDNKHSDEQKQLMPACDASFTTENQVACAIRTADCLPILITDDRGDQIAAIHAGWRGLLMGIIEKTIEQMRQVHNHELIAWIGPAICQQHFTVGAEVREQFIISNQKYTSAFIPSDETGKWQGDLGLIATNKLTGLGITQVEHSNHCTYCRPDLFDSFRRDGDSSGRIITLIWKV